MAEDIESAIVTKIVNNHNQKHNNSESPADKPNEEEQVSTSLSTSVMGEVDIPILLPEIAPAKKTSQKKALKKGSKQKSESAISTVHVVRERCRQFCFSLFFRERDPVRSLGYTSSIRGEGKTFLSLLSASVLAQVSGNHVTLVECDWEHPNYHEQFGFAPVPGMAEWLRGECVYAEIRHTILPNLTVIPAGNAGKDAVKLLAILRQQGLHKAVALPDDLLIVDLPSIVSSAYGMLAASLVEALVVVVRAGVTSEALLAETCNQLKDLPVQGLILNKLESHVPRWIRQIL